MKKRAGYLRPDAFDYNLVVIGGGSAGLVTAYIAAAVKARVALIEKDRMGGDCLNTGCVPSKALIRSARIADYARHADRFGLNPMDVRVDFKTVMERVQSVIREIAPHDSVERYTGLGVDCIRGTARITSPHTVQVNGRRLTTRAIVIATGASPIIPPIPGINAAPVYTSETVWGLRRQPEHLLVLGGGPIGTELAQAFVRLGSKVTLVEAGPRILGNEDPEVSDLVARQFEADGIRLLTGHRAVEIVNEAPAFRLICTDASGEKTAVTFDALLVAAGRKARTDGLGLEELGIALDPKGTLQTGPFLRTRIPTIYAAGDVTGPYQFTHAAAHQAWYAAVNALFSGIKSFRADYRIIPYATYTDPEVARAGLNETEANINGIAYEVTRYNLENLDRAITDSAAYGFVKVLTRPGTDKILGVTIAGHHAGEMIAEYVLAMKHNLGLNKILGTIHIYPTLAEAGKAVAGEWKKARAPEKLLRLVSRFHAWRRKYGK